LTREHLRRARELMFAIFAVWLMVQNLVLLAFVPWDKLGTAMVVANALIKTALLVFAPLWILPLAVLVGFAITVHGARVAEASREHESLEVRHG
jgi:hypothetical protein